MVVNPYTDLIGILEDQWNADNTSGILPKILRITDQKRLSYGKERAFILLHRSRPLTRPAGIGTALKHQEEIFDLDVRVFGAENEDLYFEIITELDRVLDNQIVLPGTSILDVVNYTILDGDGQRQDLSDKKHNVWRMTVPVKLIKYAKVR